MSIVVAAMSIMTMAAGAAMSTRSMAAGVAAATTMTMRRKKEKGLCWPLARACSFWASLRVF